MGALISAGMAVESPRMVSRVALLNGVFRRSDTARQAVVARAEQIRAGHVNPQAPLDRWFSGAPKDIQTRAQVAGWLSEVSLEGYAAAYSAFATGDAIYADRLAQIDCPFLALTADGDPNSTPAMSNAMAQLARKSTAVTIAGHRHMVNLTAPEEVNTHLTAWMQTAVPKESIAT